MRKGRRKGAKGRRIKTIPIQIRMDKELHDRLWSTVDDTTTFIESAIKEKLDRDPILTWAQQEEVLLRAGLNET